MKLVLLDDVKTLGKAGAVVDVAEGYARNFLLPRKLAAEASKGTLSVLAEKKRVQNKRESEALAATQALAQLLESKPVSVRAKCGGNGRLFGAITNSHIADAIRDVFEVTLDRHKIDQKTNIKALGSYPVEIRLGNNIVAKATVNVVAA